MPKKKGLRAVAPPVTLGFIAVITAVFVLDFLVFVPQGVNRWSFSRIMLGETGGAQGPIFQALCLRTSLVRQGQVWRVLSLTLLHGGFLTHLLPNCLALWVVGGPVEHELGPWRYLLVLLVSAVFASLCDMRILGQACGYGASVAIYGVIGVYAALRLKNRARTRAITTRPQRILLLLYVASNIVMDQYTLVEHGGGFLAGLVLSFWIL